MKNQFSKLRIVNGFQMKLLMVFLMFLSHLHYVNNLLSPVMVSFFNVVSRCVAPMFAFFAVEGIRHTYNLKKYCIRLSLLAGTIFIGNTIINTAFSFFSRAWTIASQSPLYVNNNVVFTIAVGVLSITLVLQAKEKDKLVQKLFYIISIILSIIGFLWGEWGTVIIPLMYIEFFFNSKKMIRFIGYVLIEMIAIILPFGEPLYFLVFPLLLFYNSERGLTTAFSKYFFYFFYPIHIWILYIINFILVSNCQIVGT